MRQAGLVTVDLRGREQVDGLDTDRLLTVTGGWLSHFG
jgi:hypothetical protein